MAGNSGARCREARQGGFSMLELLVALLVQVDHMTYSKDGRTLKEVPADSSSPTVCPVSKFMASRVLSRATAGRTPRAKARALPGGHARGHAVPRRLHPTRRAAAGVDRRQRGSCAMNGGRLRARLPAVRHPPLRPAAPPAIVERVRRAGQPLRTDRILEPPRRSPHRRRRHAQARPARVPPQPPAAALSAGLRNAQRVPCRNRGCCLIRQAQNPKGPRPLQSLYGMGVRWQSGGAPGEETGTAGVASGQTGVGGTKERTVRTRVE